MSLHGTQLLRGAQAEIVVEDASFVGSDGRDVFVTRVAWVNGGGTRGEAMPEDEARAFATQLRARVLARKGPRPSTRPGPAKTPAHAARPRGGAAGPIDDDSDIPF